MKELSIQEKAERYDKAIEIARYYYNDRAMPIGTNFKIEKMFPELKESKDERIRKALIKSFEIHDLRALIIPGFSAKDIIAWLEKQGESTDINPSEFDLRLNKLLKQFETLSKEELTSSLSFYLNVIQNDGTYREEKQGEQKPTDKVEPKFHKGEWVVYDENIYQIHNISLKQYYECLRTDGTVHIFDFEYIDSKSHLWTIADAKAGDVLETTNYVYIFHSIDKETETVSFYCLMKKSDEHFSFGDYKIHDEILNSTPATQEQRDLLFKKMKEGGYEWDAEKKLVDKIEPKFKVEAKFHEGEWITNGDYTWKIVMVKFLCYVLQSQGGNVVEDTIPHVDEKFHSFTIEDAKAGDVLASELCDSIILFKGINNDNNIDFYCDYDFYETDVPGDRFSVNNGQHYGNVEVSKDFHPATKEQRDILMKAMADAGYAFDFKKLDLKKIVVPIFNIGDTIVEKDLDECGYGTIKDIKNGQYIFTDGSGINIDEQEEWQLKTSTNIEQKPADWSEEDEKMLNQVISIIEDADDRLIRAENISIYTNWLKSLKPKYQWKPTIRQLTALEYAVNDNTLSCDELYTLNELYEQLKKL